MLEGAHTGDRQVGGGERGMREAAQQAQSDVAPRDACVRRVIDLRLERLGDPATEGERDDREDYDERDDRNPEADSDLLWQVGGSHDVKVSVLSSSSERQRAKGIYCPCLEASAGATGADLVRVSRINVARSEFLFLSRVEQARAVPGL